jgi:hypothetical protein
MKTLSYRPEDRFQDASQFAKAVEEELLRIGGTDDSKRISNYITNVFPQRVSAVEKVTKEIVLPEFRKSMNDDTLVEDKFKLLPSAPFEDLADDIDEVIPTAVWQKEDSSIMPSSWRRKARSEKYKAIVISITLGLSVGVIIAIISWIIYMYIIQ